MDDPQEYSATPARHETAAVRENVRVARDTYRIRLAVPGIAAAITPGQFVMLRLTGGNDPLLGRPFALYDTVRDDAGVVVALDVVYLVVGRVTGGLAELRPGDRVECWGPLGNGFPDLSGCRNVTLVAGGIGQTPFLAYTRQLLGERGYGNRPASRRVELVSLLYGVRTADLAACVEDFHAAGAEVRLASNDGSLGRRGLVTDLLRENDLPDAVVACGPEPMMHAVAAWAADARVKCWLSLETPMACGLGVCYSCVTRVRTADGWDYRRVCVDGPVFAATDLVLSTPNEVRP